MSERSAQQFKRVLPLLIAAAGLAYLVVFTTLDLVGFARLGTSDMYEDTLVARLMWEQKTIFPASFLFGNQFYVIATPVLAALFYGLTGSMNLGMSLATLVMSVLLILSMNWMLRPFVKDRLVRWAALLLFAASCFGPSSARREDGAQLFFVLCSFYACYLICSFVVLGDYARSYSDASLRPVPLLLALGLCFCSGMQSLRQTCVTILPLLCLEALRLIRRARRQDTASASGGRMPLIRAVLYTAANYAGAVLIRLIGPRQHTIYLGSSVFSGASLTQKLRETHHAISVVTGFDYARAGEAHLFFLLMFLFCAGLIAAAAWLLLRSRERRSGVLAVFWLFTLLACVGVLVAFFVTSVTPRAIYLFPYYTLPALSFLIVVRAMDPGKQSALTLLLLVLSCTNLFFSYRDDLNAAFTNTNSVYQQISDYAVTNGYELVYGAQSHGAADIALCSDGALIAGCWRDDTPFRVSNHINIRDIYSLSDSARAIFVIQQYELDEGILDYIAQYDDIEFTLRGQYGPYYVFTSSRQLLYPITDTIDYGPFKDEY